MKQSNIETLVNALCTLCTCLIQMINTPQKYHRMNLYFIVVNILKTA